MRNMCELTDRSGDYYTNFKDQTDPGDVPDRLSVNPAALHNPRPVKPKVFCVGELADQGAGHPDFGLNAAEQVQRGRPREGQTPERGGGRSGQPVLGALSDGARDQHARFRAGSRGRGWSPGEARNLPACCHRDFGAQGGARAGRSGRIPASLGTGEASRASGDGGVGAGIALWDRQAHPAARPTLRMDGD